MLQSIGLQRFGHKLVTEQQKSGILKLEASLSNSEHRGHPMSRIVSSGVSLLPWSTPGSLIFFKACCCIFDSHDSVFIYSVSREIRVMQRKEGGGRDCGGGMGTPFCEDDCGE